MVHLIYVYVEHFLPIHHDRFSTPIQCSMLSIWASIIFIIPTFARLVLKKS